MRLLVTLALVALAGCNPPGVPASPTRPPTSVPPPQAVASDAPSQLPAATPRPRATVAAALDIRLVSDRPVIEGGPGCGATLPASYTIADGVHHLYYVCFGDLPGDQVLTYAASDDGLSWEVSEQPDPLGEFPIEFSPPGHIPGSVVPIDGEWAMYLWGVPAPQQQGAQIYRALATDPAGPWSGESEPVLPVGEPGDVDDLGLDFPSVVTTADGYLMLYGANGGDRPHAARILAARSTDGISWEKLGRVIEPEDCGGAATDYVAIPRLFTTDDGFMVLALLGDDIVALQSGDGLMWDCVGDGPIFRAAEVDGSTRVHTLAAARDGERIYVVIEALFEEETVFSNLWLAEVTGL